MFYPDGNAKCTGGAIILDKILKLHIIGQIVEVHALSAGCQSFLTFCLFPLCIPKWYSATDSWVIEDSSLSSVSSHTSLDYPLSCSCPVPKATKFGSPLDQQTGTRHGSSADALCKTPPNLSQWLHQGNVWSAVQLSAASTAGRFCLETEGFPCLSTAELNVLCVQTQGGEESPNIFF